MRSFASGGKVASFGFAVNNRKKNQQTGQWEDEPVWLDVEAFNSQSGQKLADLAGTWLHKGSKVFVEGHLRLDQWNDKQTGDKRSKMKIVAHTLQMLDGKNDRPQRQENSAPPPSGDDDGSIPF